MSTVIDEVALEDLEVDPSVLAASVRPEPASPVVLAFDLGTSGVRSALFDRRGHEIEGSQVAMASEFHSELGSGADADAELLFELVTRALDVAVARAEGFVSRVDYVAAACFWHSLVGVDSDGRAVTPILGWADTRAGAAAGELRSRFDETCVQARTGCRFHPSYWPAKLLWLKQERGELFDKAERWISFSDYLSLQLLGEAATSVSMASATGLLHQATAEWDRELLEGLNLSIEQLPRIAARGSVNRLLEAHALRWPLLESAEWFPAIGDGAANNIGAGCATPDRAALMIGTSGAMRILFTGDPPPSMRPELFCYRADHDRVVIGGALSDGGGLHRWMKDALALPFDADELELSLAAIAPDSHGLTVLPFWSGERATGWSSSARGTITGLTAGTRPIEILRASMEAICYRFALLAKALEAITPAAQIVAAGNALLASPVWRQMIADVLGRPIEISGAREASCRGAALLALEAIGTIGSIETTNAEVSEVLKPDLPRHLIYAKAIERQEDLYRRVIT
jgi:gluconokinase